ncbi:excalibur calcium-binding domain-containing protein [Caenimonas koreensis]|nr:excalibur calcium-binding domain-containing protein [Caenimonas koreensis]
MATAAATASPVVKCTVNGSVVFQQSPCPPTGAIQRPTVEELNARAKKRRAATAASAARKADPGTSYTFSPYRCDGRTRCSQMKSCAEAKYFLDNCPGAQMDGDHNGIPCEKQWCTP